MAWVGARVSHSDPRPFLDVRLPFSLRRKKLAQNLATVEGPGAPQAPPALH